MAEPDPAGLRPRSGRTSRAWIMVVLVLGVAGAAVLVMLRRDAPAILPAAEIPPAGEPDFYMEQATVSQYRADGSLEYRLVAARIRHYEHDARTELEAPELTLHDAWSPPWHASARRGVLRRPPAAREERLALRGEVTLKHRAADRGPLKLETPAMTLYPRRQYAETDRDVMIASDVGVTTATGLQGDLQLGFLQFLSANGERVHTVLEPEHFK